MMLFPLLFNYEEIKYKYLRRRRRNKALDKRTTFYLLAAIGGQYLFDYTLPAKDMARYRFSKQELENALEYLEEELDRISTLAETITAKHIEYFIQEGTYESMDSVYDIIDSLCFIQAIIAYFKNHQTRIESDMISHITRLDRSIQSGYDRKVIMQLLACIPQVTRLPYFDNWKSMVRPNASVIPFSEGIPTPIEEAN